MEWEFPIHYKAATPTIKAVVEYKSKTLIRVRVHGRRSTLLVESDYPAILFSQSKKGVRWKLREGRTDFAGTDSAKMLLEIFQALEFFIKRDLQELYPGQWIPG